MNSSVPRNDFWRIYLWCLSYLSPYKFLFFMYLFLGTVSAAVPLIIAKLFQIFIDKILPEKHLGQYALLIIGVFFFI